MRRFFCTFVLRELSCVGHFKESVTAAVQETRAVIQNGLQGRLHDLIEKPSIDTCLLRRKLNLEHARGHPPAINPSQAHHPDTGLVARCCTA